MHVLGNSRYSWHESHSVQFSSTSASIVVACWGYSWINTLKLKKNNCCIVFFLRPSLFCCSTLSFCAQPSVLAKSCRFFTTFFSASPPTLGASFCAKTILRTHVVAKSVRGLPCWATSLRQYCDLWHTPTDQFSRASKTAPQRCDRCQTQVSETESRWPPAPRAEAAAKLRMEPNEFAQWENLEIFHVFCYVWYKYLNFWFEYSDFPSINTGSSFFFWWDVAGAGSPNESSHVTSTAWGSTRWEMRLTGQFKSCARCHVRTSGR